MTIKSRKLDERENTNDIISLDKEWSFQVLHSKNVQNVWMTDFSMNNSPSNTIGLLKQESNTDWNDMTQLVAQENKLLRKEIQVLSKLCHDYQDSIGGYERQLFYHEETLQFLQNRIREIESLLQILLLEKSATFEALERSLMQSEEMTCRENEAIEYIERLNFTILNMKDQIRKLEYDGPERIKKITFALYSVTGERNYWEKKVIGIIIFVYYLEYEWL